MKLFNTSTVTSKSNMYLKKEAKAWLLMSPVLILIIMLVWYPQIMSFIWSTFEMAGYNKIGFAGLDNYKNVLSDTLFPKALANTLKYVFWSLLMGYIPPLFVALLLNEVVHFKSGFRFCIYFPAVLPSISVSLMWYLIFFPDAGGMLNMFLAMFGAEPLTWLQNSKLTIPLIVFSATWSGLPGTMLLYYSVLQGIDRELYEAAIIDGAGVMRRVFSITIPRMSGTLLLILVRQIMGIFQILDQPMAMTGGGPNNASISLAYLAYKQGIENFRIGPSMALGNVLFVLLIILTAFYFALKNKVDSQMD